MGILKKKKKTKKKTTSYSKRIKTKFEDKKFRNYLGFSFILVAVLLVVSFTSSLSTWKNDNDIMFNSWFDYLFNSNISSQNIIGKLGALFSHIFIYKWFGIASYLLAGLFFIVGIYFFNFYKKSLIPITKNVFFLVFWLSVSFALMFSHKDLDPLYGQFGYDIHEWLKSIIGLFGEILFLLISMLIFLTIVIDEFSEKAREILSTMFSKISLGSSFANFSEKLFSEKANKKSKKTKQEKIIDEEFDDVANDDSYNNKNTVVIDLDEEDDEKEIKTVEKKNYKLLDDGNEIIQEDDDLGFEVENTKPKQTEVTEQVKEEEIKPKNTQPEFRRIQVGELALDVTYNQDILSERIDANKFTNYDPTLDLSNFTIPSIDLLDDHNAGNPEVTKDELLRNKNRIVNTLKQYKIEIIKIKATIGPTLTLYEIVPAPGVRISKIRNLEDDIALSLAAIGIRIIAPMPGRGTIGIEVPNEKPDIVSFKSVIKSTAFQESNMELPIALGKTISNESYVFDLAKMPHMLIAGATGQGKSVGLNAIIASLLYKKHPAQVKLVLVDPKKVELSLYEGLENHYLATLPDAKEPIITDNQEVVHTVSSLNIEMDDRYSLLKKGRCKNIKEYNKKFIARQLNPEKGHKYLPYIVLVIDEFADLIMTAGKEIELPIARLAQLARAIGIHLIVATQRPSTNIITGVIKANFPARVAFRVASMVDSRTILDSPGANRLIGRGDMLMTQGSNMIRLQCAFIDTPELDRITEYISKQQSYPMPFLLPEPETGEDDIPGAVDLASRDELFEESARIIVMAQQGSTSMIQRKLAIGYNRAGRIVDQLEAAGIVGPAKGSKARDVYIMDEYSLQTLLDGLP